MGGCIFVEPICEMMPLL